MPRNPAIAARTGGRDILANALRDARTRTLSLLDAYVDELGPGLPVPYSEQLNPPLWVVGHVGCFQDSVGSASTAIPTTNDRGVGCRKPTPFTTPVASPTRRAGSCRCLIWRPRVRI